MKIQHLLLFAFALIFSLNGCKKEEDNTDEQAEIDRQLIEDYIAENDLDALSAGDGLYYVIDVPGSPEHPNKNSTVTVHYKGFLLNGNQFDSSYTNGYPIVTPLSNVIEGWQKGIPYFGKGGKGKLLIPSGLAYGRSPKQGIPANSVLIFDIHLVNFQ